MEIAPGIHYVEAPEPYRYAHSHGPAVFLAGGITACPDWQAEATNMFVAAGEPMVIFNPRRSDFPIDKPEESETQVRWEHWHLHAPGALTMMWFPACDPARTTQPIALFELGAALGEHRPLLVGADPSYPRVTDVRLQVHLVMPGLKVHSRLSDLVAATTAWVVGPKS